MGFIGLAQDKLLLVRRYIEEGEFGWKILGALGGGAMAISGFFGFIGNVLLLITFSSLAALQGLIICLVGVLLMALELKDNFLPYQFQKFIKTEVHVLYTPFGRAVCYMIIGILMVTMWNTVYSLIGLCVTCIGGYIFYSSRKAFIGLQEMKLKKFDEATLHEYFAKYDDERVGGLDSTGLTRLLNDMGSHLNHSEMESALLILDKNVDGKISFDEFKEWYMN